MQKNTLCPHVTGNVNAKYSECFSPLRSYKFKLEGIYSSTNHGELLGYEILLDFKKAKIDDHSAEYIKAIYDGSAIEYLVSRLAKLITSGYKANKAKRVFINFERIHLCNPVLLRKIALLSKGFFLSDIELVVEITERNECGYCPRIIEGLRVLKNHGVILAADDLDIYTNQIDFRFGEVLAGLYDYVKIEMPRNKQQVAIYNEFLLRNERLHSFKVILERVESLCELSTIIKPFGLQGYAFNH